MIGLRPILSRQPAEEDEERRRQRQRDRDQDVGGRAIHLQRLFEEEQRVELPGIPDHRLPRDRAEQRDQHPFEIAPARESLGQRRLGRRPLVLHLLEYGAFGQLQPDPQRHREQQDRDQERHAPAPGGEGLLAHHGAQSDHDEQSREQPHRRGGLDPAGVEPALPLGRVLGDIGRRPAIFAAQREALQQAQRDQDERRGDADRRIARQQSDREGRKPHDPHGDEEGVLAPDHVADAPEHQSAERPHGEPGGEGGEREDEPRRLVHAGEELRRDVEGEQAVEIEIIPLEHGAERRRGDDEFLVLCRLVVLRQAVLGGCRHHAISPHSGGGNNASGNKDQPLGVR